MYQERISSYAIECINTLHNFATERGRVGDYSDASAKLP